MTQMYTELESELEDELEDEAFFGGRSQSASNEFEGELEGEDEGEGEFEDELEGEFEDEFEGELENEFELEGEGEGELEDEAFFGGLVNLAGSLLGGQGEGEFEDELEGEGEAEEFFKNIGRALRRAAPMLRQIAKVAAPMVATAFGGPAAGAIARAVTSQLEGELEAELEEMATAPVSERQAMAEYLAARAATTESEAEAEAFTGSAVTVMLRDSDRRQLEQLLPQLVQGAATLTRVLRRRRETRPAVRLVPSIIDSAARSIVGGSGDGAPVDPGVVAPALAAGTGRVLGDPYYQRSAARRHARGLAYAYRRRQSGTSRRGGGTGVRRTRSATTIRRQPSRVRVASRDARVTRPPNGFVRVVTPVRVPPRGGQPARTVRVVSDVRLPRGAVPAGRPASLPARRAAPVPARRR